MIQNMWRWQTYATPLGHSCLLFLPYVRDFSGQNHVASSGETIHYLGDPGVVEKPSHAMVSNGAISNSGLPKNINTFFYILTHLM